MSAIQFFMSTAGTTGDLFSMFGFEPETVRTILMMDSFPSQKQADEYDIFIKAVKSGHNLALGFDNLVNIFDSLSIGCGHSSGSALLNYVKTLIINPPLIFLVS